MKFNVPALALVLSLPLLAAAAGPCDGCDIQSVNAIGTCKPAWVDKLTSCGNAPCNVKYNPDPLMQCEVGVDNSTSTGTTIGTITATGTATVTATGTATVTATATSTSTGKYNSTNTATTTGPKTTDSGAAAAPAFGGIGFGGGAAAMVGLAGLVGLVL